MNKKTILVVDDDFFNRQITADLLMATGLYSVMSATGGEQGCTLALRFQPDLILMDWNMPGLTGYQAVQQIRADEKTKDIPVIFVTGSEHIPGADQLKEMGVVGFIAKPINEEELLHCIQKVFNGGNE